MRRVKSPLLAATSIGGAAILVASSTVVAHDFWIIPDAFAVEVAAPIGVRGQTSSLFPTSVSAVTPDRVVDARVVTAGETAAIPGGSVRGTSLILSATPLTLGQHVVAVRLAPRNVRETPESFRRYLDLEGAPEARLRYEREGRLPPIGGDSITRRYAKYAKTFVEVGRGPRSFSQSVGHPLEMIPLADPSALLAGDTLRVRVLLLGEALRDAKLHAGSASAASLADTAAARRAAAGDVSITTDGAGVATLVVAKPGLWNVRTIQIVPATRGSGADWDVHWATVTFRVNPR